ncbi:alpha/beta fold hydrolase [Microvirga roseola]|uniref:alpha/beta fold hydrolase n=1 Tax=Microvirga roseola TaxID=2883126 RepID=UPI001E308707|nr:alpha/beta fold hydrolase [Microvirga roseola]
MHSFARNGDVFISFRDFGEGQPLVLLHGFSLSSRDWFDMGYVEPLVEAGYRPILVDIRGHGESGKPHEPDAYTEEAQAGDIASVLDALGIERADILGYSRGGRMALDFACLYPDRVVRLVIGGGHPFRQDMSQFRAATAHGIEGWLAVIEQSGGPLPAQFRTRVAANDITALRAAVALDRPDISGELGALRSPCLFFVGADDPLRPLAHKAGTLLQTAKVIDIPGCNHMTALQRADLVVPHVLEFLTESEPIVMNA